MDVFRPQERLIHLVLFDEEAEYKLSMIVDEFDQEDLAECDPEAWCWLLAEAEELKRGAEEEEEAA